MPGLLLAGHGSIQGPETAAPVHEHARRIAALRLFDEVQVAFYKQEPRLPDAVARFESDRVVVVPVFLAEGYYTRQVLPRELGLRGPRRSLHSKQVSYAHAVGTHPLMAELALQRAHSADLRVAERRNSALALVAHGTDRSRTSGSSADGTLRRLRRISDFGSVHCGFLDQEPRIESVITSISARTIVIVPFLLAAGWHTRHTIPSRLGLTGERTERDDRTYWYVDPVGTLPEVASLIVDLTQPAAGVAGFVRA